MAELESILKLWREERQRKQEVCLATVVAVEGSSYRKPGARMLVTRGGRRAGTISGGCLEAEVQKKAWWLTETGPAVERYSSFYDEDSEMPYGLGCGGTVDVLLERCEAADRVLEALEQSLNTRRAIVIVSAVDPETSGPEVSGARLCGQAGTRFALNHKGEFLFGAAEGARSVALAKRALREQKSLWDGGFFAEYVPARVGLLVAGAGDDALPLVEFASRLSWHTTVVDGRSHLATRERFPMADRVLPAKSLDELTVTGRDAAVILTHSYEQDREALRTLLPSAVGYLGLLGPRQRTERLLGEVGPELGLTVEECRSRLHSPVGLNIGAKDPVSIALAIIAEVYSVMERTSAKPAAKEGNPASVHA
jgi:xanthine dehydrogenase accessory factor